MYKSLHIIFAGVYLYTFGGMKRLCQILQAEFLPNDYMLSVHYGLLLMTTFDNRLFVTKMAVLYECEFIITEQLISRVFYG